MENKISTSTTWLDIIKAADKTSVPAISGKSLGNDILDTALEKASRNMAAELSIPHSVVKRKLIDTLRQDRVARRTEISTIRFLRDASSSLFTECPECGFENEPEWDRCENCKIKNPD
jgi:hypothetical protein